VLIIAFSIDKFFNEAHSGDLINARTLYMSTSLIYVTNFKAVTSYNNGLEVLAAATVKTNIFRDVTPCSLMFTNVGSTWCRHYRLGKWRNVLDNEKSILPWRWRRRC